MPYSLPAGSAATIQVVSNGTPLNQLSNVTDLAQAVSIFVVNGNGSAAAALNEDYTVNFPQHPARPGSAVMLFRTGGGQTNPPSVAEVMPLELRPLLSVPLWHFSILLWSEAAPDRPS